MKTTSAEDRQNMFCACVFHGNPMNNLLSCCGLIDAKIRASDKDLPVPAFETKSLLQHGVFIKLTSEFQKEKEIDDSAFNPLY